MRHCAQTEEKRVRKKLAGGRYMTLETRKDGTKFTSRPLREAAERLQAVSRSYDQRQAALVEQARAAFPPSHARLVAGSRLPAHLHAPLCCGLPATNAQECSASEDISCGWSEKQPCWCLG